MINDKNVKKKKKKKKKKYKKKKKKKKKIIFQLYKIIYKLILFYNKN